MKFTYRNGARFEPAHVGREIQMRSAIWKIAGLLLFVLLGSVSVAQAGFINPPAGFTEVKLQSGKRNNIFYADEAVAFTYSAANIATSYTVRDYYGNIVAQGAAGDSLALGVLNPGWYKIYLFGTTDRGAPYGTSVGGTTFCVFRRDSHFPDRPTPDTAGGAKSPDDVATHEGVVRGMVGLGPDRHQAYLNNLPGTFKQLDGDTAIDQQWYLNSNDSAHPRDLLIAFGNGTGDSNAVSQVVNRYKGIVTHYEPRNEPQNVSSMDFLQNELIPFYKAVKAASPTAKVTGPGIVSIVGAGQLPYPATSHDMLSWLEEVLARGGSNYLDAYSFHAYNTVNGDLALGRRSLDAQRALLQRCGMGDKEVWQTEQGYGAPLYGVYAPRHQGRWIMLQRMLFEQYNIPKEHDYYWYDNSYGFNEFPYWFKNGDNSLNPVIPLMRVYSEETYGKKFVRALDLGPVGNKMFIGNLFSGAGGSVVVLCSAGSTPGMLKLNVGSGASAVDAFGNPVSLSVSSGVATIPVPEIPIYVHTGGGTPDAAQNSYGPNWARLPGTVITSSGDNTDIAKLNNGEMETSYYTSQASDAPWNAGPTAPTAKNPITVDVTLPEAKLVGRAIIYATPPHQSQTSLLDYDLMYDDNGTWRTLVSVQEPPKVVSVYSPNVSCTQDEFYSDRWIFEHSFTPVITKKIRLVVRDVTAGGMPTTDLAGICGGSEGGPKRLVLREIELYPDQPQTYAINGHVYDIGSGTPKGLAGVTVNLSGDRTATTTTDATGQYTLNGIVPGGTYSVSASGASQSFAPAKRTFVNLAADRTADFYNPTGTGLEGDYYNSTNLNSLVFTRFDPSVDFDWSTGSPHPDVGGSDNNNFSARWTGFVQPLESGTYTFVTKTDNGVRLWVGDMTAPLVSDWDGPASGDQYREHRATVTLKAFTKYPVRMEMWEGGDNAVAKLDWRPPSFQDSDPDEAIAAPELYLPLQPGSGNGLKAEYFSDPKFTNRQALRIDPTVNFDWGGNAPNNTDGTAMGTMGADNFSVRWSGFIELPETADCVAVPSNDDQANLYIDNKLVPNGQNAHLIGGKRYAIRIEYIEHSANASIKLYWKGASMQYPDIVEQSYLYSGDDGTGLLGQYFNGEDFTTKVAEQIDPQVNFVWGRTAPLPGVNPEHFSVRWRGKIKPWFSETYTFSTRSDERIRLWVNGQAVIDHWTAHDEMEDSGTIALQAGQLYDIQIDYADVTWLATARLYWQSPSTPKQIVPYWVLYPATATAPLSVALTAPSDGSQYSIGTPIDLTATIGAITPKQTATDMTPPSVSKIEFYEDTTKLGEDTSAPYTFRWTGATNGSHSLTAKAYDAQGNAVTSTPITVSVTAPDSNLGTGLRGTYFDQQNLTQQHLMRIDPKVDFTWPNGTAPVSDMPSTKFSVRWEGQVRPRETGDWTFTTLTDDGIRLWVDGKLILNIWGDMAATSLSSAPIHLVAGTRYDIKMEYYQNAGDARARLSWSDANVSPEVIPTENLYPLPLPVTSPPAQATPTPTPTVVPGTGLRGTYFDQLSLAAPRLVRVDPTVGFNWPAGKSPSPDIAPTTFSVRWEGQVRPKETGDWTFMALTDDGVRLWVDGKLVIDHWQDHSAAVWSSAPIHLVAGTRYDIKMEYYQNAGSAQVYLGWNDAKIAREIIPKENLYPSPLPTSPPSVRLTAPSDGAQYTAPASLSIAATASDAAGISTVAFYVNGIKISEDAGAPYNAALSGLSAGSYIVTARAWDNTGLSTTSAPVKVTVVQSAAPTRDNSTSDATDSADAE